MLRWLPLLLLPIVGFAITKNCQNSPQNVSEAKEENPAPQSVADVVVTPTMQLVVKRSSTRQPARSEQVVPRKKEETIHSGEQVVEQDEQMQDHRALRRDAKDALSEEIARHAEPSRSNQNEGFLDDKKWMDSLSGLSLQNNKGKSVKPECDAQRCASRKPYVNVFGVVFEAENPELNGELGQGSFAESTPAFYIK